MVPPEEAEERRAARRPRRKPVSGPKSKETQFGQELAGWLGPASGCMNSDQTIDMYLLSCLGFASGTCLLSVFVQICVPFLPVDTPEATG